MTTWKTVPRRGFVARHWVGVDENGTEWRIDQRKPSDAGRLHNTRLAILRRMPNGTPRQFDDVPSAKAATEPVCRYVATYVNKDGMRTLMGPAQGRNTYATAAEAQAWIDAATANNSADTVRQIWGANPRFEVRGCPCWPVHFDPQTRWFDHDTAGAPPTPMNTSKWAHNHND
jgi:hypothetical protein